jgi:hypothetical protein
MASAAPALLHLEQYQSSSSHRFLLFFEGVVVFRFLWPNVETIFLPQFEFAAKFFRFLAACKGSSNDRLPSPVAISSLLPGAIFAAVTLLS